MRWLVSELNRTPADDLHDIDCGKNLSAISELTQLQRMLYEAAEDYVEFQEFNGRYEIKSIISKRNPELNDATEQFFATNKEGTRIPLTEEEYNKEIVFLLAEKEFEENLDWKEEFTQKPANIVVQSKDGFLNYDSNTRRISFKGIIQE